MAKTQTDKYMLSLAGEHAVCSELLRRGIPCTLTLGNAKAADIIVTAPNVKTRIIEVKTSSSNRFVTNFFQKYPTPKTVPHPDFWVVVQIDKDCHATRYFVLTHSEMAQVQMRRNQISTWSRVNGVDNVLLKHVLPFENRWDKIAKLFPSS